MARLGMITFDTADPRPLAAWWAERLGGKIVHDMDGWFCMVQADAVPVALGFQKIADPTPGKNRVHLDLERSPGEERDAVVAEWTAAGATHLGTRGDENFAWDTFEDPAGNQFCISDTH
ncbi:VOC family protein [Leucobacter sp. CSA2]|uniref:VOC family protein n=1 Tax=Leucobacter edaphi TaxID=2796472 RepID=A0A934QCY3_9MICO|nr:VOC family protein [Leucobacter edaphi]MBK0420972.1 VOC family protein [Leucobacter edaphi]